jgi:hypothetical protein
MKREYRVVGNNQPDKVYRGIQWIRFFDSIKPEDEGYVVIAWDDFDRRELWFVEGDDGLAELRRYYSERKDYDVIKYMILNYMEWR